MSTIEKTTEPMSTGHWIGGKPVEGAATFEVRNPSRRSEIVGVVADGTAADARAAVDAGVDAAASWADTPVAERVATLRRIACNA